MLKFNDNLITSGYAISMIYPLYELALPLLMKNLLSLEAYKLVASYWLRTTESLECFF